MRIIKHILEIIEGIIIWDIFARIIIVFTVLYTLNQNIKDNSIYLIAIVLFIWCIMPIRRTLKRFKEEKE